MNMFSVWNSVQVGSVRAHLPDGNRQINVCLNEHTVSLPGTGNRKLNKIL